MSLETIFWGAFIVGGAVMIFQFALLLLGFGDLDADVDFEVDDLDGDVEVPRSGFLGMISVRTVTAFVAFFGIGGLAVESAGFPPLHQLIGALAAGSGAFVGMFFLGKALHGLRQEHVEDIQETLGQTATVYLRIPSGGEGKVTVVISGRQAQFKAIGANGCDLATGTSAKVTKVLTSDLLEVEPV